ncbi:hypothetical protein SAMN05421507_11872 [Lentzea jiangxiensis]|uniref:Uncharacterized protein n=1 Tax=Lentzea jiangxiensis TaxID=641025 RepID=A0A1H0WCA7_9PSEU|nr:hypothetical protein SAMN05421507_11872 [Lentzea jiangxiensis]
MPLITTIAPVTPQYTAAAHVSSQWPPTSTSTPPSRESGNAVSATRALPQRAVTRGSSLEAMIAPRPQQLNRAASRASPSGATPRTWSANGTSNATHAPLATECVAPTRVRTRMTGSCHRNRRPSRTSAAI